MECSKCKSFLHDFLLNAMEPDMHIYKLYKHEYIKKHIVKLTNFILRLKDIVPEEIINFARERAVTIPKQLIENHKNFERDLYYPFIYGAMKVNIEEFSKEITHISWFLIDSSCFVLKSIKDPLKIAELYLCYVVPKALCLMQEIHNEHKNHINIANTIALARTTSMNIITETSIEASLFPPNITSIISHDNDVSIEGVQEIHIGVNDDVWSILNSN